MRLLLYVWKERHVEHDFMNDNLRRELIKFYMLFCKHYYNLFNLIKDSSMFTLIYLLYKYSIYNEFLFLTSFVLFPQIIHSARNGRHYKLNYYYFFGFILPRILIPVALYFFLINKLYFRGCTDNLF